MLQEHKASADAVALLIDDVALPIYDEGSAAGVTYNFKRCYNHFSILIRYFWCCCIICNCCYSTCQFTAVCSLIVV